MSTSAEKLLDYLDRIIAPSRKKKGPFNYDDFDKAKAIVESFVELLSIASDQCSVRDYFRWIIRKAPHGPFVRAKAREVLEFLNKHPFGGFLDLDCRDAVSWLRGFGESNKDASLDEEYDPWECDVKVRVPTKKRNLLQALHGKGLVRESVILKEMYGVARCAGDLVLRKNRLHKLQNDTNTFLQSQDIKYHIYRPKDGYLELKKY